MSQYTQPNQTVKSGSTLTFRQLIQSLRDFPDQLASVMPYAEGAEDPCWGISDIWFEDGVLMIGQYDDEGNDCGRIADDIEKCLPPDMYDKPAVVKIGVIEGEDDDRQIFDKYSEPATARTVSLSEVKPASERVTDDEEEYIDDLDEDDMCSGWSCKWVLKFQ